MKLLTYESPTGPRAGVLLDDQIIDVAGLLASEPLCDVHALLELPNEPLKRLKTAIEKGSRLQGTPLSTAKLLSPVLRPPTIRDFMVYEGHATGGGTREQSEAWYRMPIFYFSNTLRVFGTDAVVPFPSSTGRLDYELEIGMVIGREGSDISEDDAFSYIAGFTILNDWSSRDLQMDEMKVHLGPAKGKDSATSIGPWLVTTDELEPHIRDGRLHLDCTLRVNGDTWMTENAGIAHHTWGAMLERASKDSLVVPGDVFGSGTVSGGTVSEAIRNGFNARWLQPGDEIEIEVNSIGTLRNKLGEPQAFDPNYRYRAP